MTVASDKFKRGQQVKLSPEGAKAYPNLRHRTGEVCGFPRKRPAVVRIWRDGVSRPDEWHADLWQLQSA